MSLTTLFMRTCCCSSTILIPMRGHSSLVQKTSNLILSKPLGNHSSNFSVRSNLALLENRIFDRTNFLAELNLRLLSTNVPASNESQPNNYQPKLKEKVLVPRNEEKESEMKRRMRNFFFKKLSFLTGHHVRQSCGAVLYQQLTDNINYEDFFNAFSMPDTFQSWFVIIELHIWLLSARLMAEGNEGKDVRDAVVSAMWEDVRNRAKTISTEKQIQASLQELSGQLNAAFLGYDEGLLTDDKVLASALWRRFFNKECEDPRHIESMVSFTRKQMHLLESITREDLIDKQKLILLRLAY